MNYDLTTPCEDCPFLEKYRRGFSLERLEEMASGEFHCHKTGICNDESEFVEGPNSQHCAGALIYNELHNAPHQMMRICERLGMYDARKLNMKAEVRND